MIKISIKIWSRFSSNIGSCFLIQIWSDQIRCDEIKSVEVRSDHIRSDHMGWDQIRCDQRREDEIRSVQTGTGVWLCRGQVTRPRRGRTLQGSGDHLSIFYLQNKHYWAQAAHRPCNMGAQGYPWSAQSQNRTGWSAHWAMIHQLQSAIGVHQRTPGELTWPGELAWPAART